MCIAVGGGVDFWVSAGKLFHFCCGDLLGIG